jgi:hypothetical protein
MEGRCSMMQWWNCMGLFLYFGSWLVIMIIPPNQKILVGNYIW